MQVDLKPLVPPTIQKGFEATRRRLVEALQQVSFVRICVVTFPESTVRAGTHFQGEAIEVFPGRTHSQPRTCFFSRFGRGFGSSQILGSFSLIDCPFDVGHSTAIPQIGDILIGSLSPAKKGKIPFELRGWSNNAKPLLELARVLQFGTRMGENELKNLLKQPASASANMYLRLNQSMPEAQKAAARKSVEAQDDLWCLARMVCFGKLEEDKTLKISKPYVELVDALVIKYGDEEMLEAWTKLRPQEYSPEVKEDYYGGYGAPVFSYGPVAYPVYAAPPAPSYAPAPSSNAAHHSGPPSYAPGTPTYPSSPPESPKYAPSSPKYAPSSPKYEPDPLIEDTKIEDTKIEDTKIEEKKKERIPQISLYEDL